MRPIPLMSDCFHCNRQVYYLVGSGGFNAKVPLVARASGWIGCCCWCLLLMVLMVAWVTLSRATRQIRIKLDSRSKNHSSQSLLLPEPMMYCGRNVDHPLVQYLLPMYCSTCTWPASALTGSWEKRRGEGGEGEGEGGRGTER